MFKVKEHGTHDYNQFALRIQTPWEYETSNPHNLLQIAFLKKYWWIKTPMYIKPKEKWVDLSKEEWATVNPQTGKKGYTEYIQRSYGFSTFEDAIHIHYGIQPGCWSSRDPKNSDHVKLFYIPWLKWDRDYIEFLNLDHSVFSIYWDNKNGSINFDSLDSHRDTVPKIKFALKDFDGEDIVATCYLQNSRYSCGVGLFKFLKFFKKKDYLRMDIAFDKETGYEKGSWKGGTIGTSCEVMPGETPLVAFHRYAGETDRYKNHGRKPRGMSNIRIIE